MSIPNELIDALKDFTPDPHNPLSFRSTSPSIYLALRETKLILITTKWYSLCDLLQFRHHQDYVTVVNMHKTFSPEHVDTLRALRVLWNCSASFLGSISPHDLTVYRSLQDGGWDESLTSHDKFVVSWLGANDEWLDFCEQRLVNERPTSTNHAGLVDSIGIPFPECERRVWSVLEGNAFDVGSIIGPRAYAALSDEILIGLEGLINFRFYGSNFIRDLNHKFLRMNFKG